MAPKLILNKYRNLLYALLISSGVSLALYFTRVIFSHSWTYWFLAWNLLLAWLPLITVLGLLKWLKRRRWLSVGGILITILWLLLLPNSFYLISDFVHIQPRDGVGLLNDIIMLASFAWSGLAVGFASLLIVHYRLRKLLSVQMQYLAVTIVLLLCSYAIYLGRFYHWNTWDVLINPAGILFDVSDHVINPVSYPQALSTTIGFFLLLGSMYLVFWRALSVVPQGDQDG